MDGSSSGRSTDMVFIHILSEPLRRYASCILTFFNAQGFVAELVRLADAHQQS